MPSPLTGLGHPRIVPPSVIDPIHHPTTVPFHAPGARLTGVAPSVIDPVFHPVEADPFPMLPAPAPATSTSPPSVIDPVRSSPAPVSPPDLSFIGGAFGGGSSSRPAPTTDDASGGAYVASSAAPMEPRVGEATLPSNWKREAAIVAGGVVVIGGLATAAVLALRPKKGRR